MSTTMVTLIVAAFLVGAVLFAISNKKREENGEWSGCLQWGYLLMMIGLFGLLSITMSITAALLIVVLFTGVLWFWQRHQRKKDAQRASNNHFTDYMSGFFPIILVVFLLRTFLVEPFQIPSSSMRPGLVVGDFILVNKFVYGIRVPILNNVLIPISKVERGDVVVFNYPQDTSINYIKRVIGLPGDTVSYQNKVLRINGKEIADVDREKVYPYDENTLYGVQPMVAQEYGETLDSKKFTVLKMPDRPPVIRQDVQDNFPYRNQCHYADDGSGFSCTVPAGHYFMMGDNRDDSADGRYWGFVDDKLMVGKAFFVWLNVHDMGRAGTRIR